MPPGRRDCKGQASWSTGSTNTVRPDGKWSNERVIIFTEYRATQNWLQTILASEGLTGNDRLMTMYGGMDSEKREAVKAAFQTAPDKSPVRILLATDAASRRSRPAKLLLTASSTTKFPGTPTAWNSGMAASTVTGRGDKVLVYHFVGKGYKEREKPDIGYCRSANLEADLEFLMRAVRKVEAIREDLGKVGPVIAEQVKRRCSGSVSD